MLAKTNLQQVKDSMCPACGHCVAVDFYHGGFQPLATLAWPKTRNEAIALSRYPVNFVRCVYCGHIYNPEFRYENVPYSTKPNLMFNKGADWSVFIQNIQRKLISILPDSPTIIEIGYGDGSFLYGLDQLVPNAKLIGFDPHGAKNSPNNITLRNELFLPDKHLAELKPDLIISRHVLEHLVNPVGFLEHIAFCVGQLSLNVCAYFEVPCVDNMITSNRTVDLYYEHNSQFTTKSFSVMLNHSGAEVLEIGHGYDDEVIFSIIRMANHKSKDIALESSSFYQKTLKSHDIIQCQLNDLFVSGKSIAIWGGTGKSAAFINRYNCDAERFPLVVDSDKDKVNTFVPGTGQRILFRDYLKDNQVQVIIIPPQWRAKDILSEMKSVDIHCEKIIIEHKGTLVDYFTHVAV